MLKLQVYLFLWNTSRKAWTKRISMIDKVSVTRRYNFCIQPWEDKCFRTWLAIQKKWNSYLILKNWKQSQKSNVHMLSNKLVQKRTNGKIQIVLSYVVNVSFDLYTKSQLWALGSTGKLYFSEDIMQKVFVVPLSLSLSLCTVATSCQMPTLLDNGSLGSLNGSKL